MALFTFVVFFFFNCSLEDDAAPAGGFRIKPLIKHMKLLPLINHEVGPLGATESYRTFCWGASG